MYDAEMRKITKALKEVKVVSSRNTVEDYKVASKARSYWSDVLQLRTRCGDGGRGQD